MQRKAFYRVQSRIVEFMQSRMASWTVSEWQDTTEKNHGRNAKGFKPANILLESSSGAMLFELTLCWNAFRKREAFSLKGMQCGKLEKKKTVKAFGLGSLNLIVRKNIQDAVPKAVMHLLVNHTKRELHSVFITKLYREHLFEEMLQEREDIAVRRKRCKEVLRVLQQAAHTLEDLPLDFEVPMAKIASVMDATGLPPSMAKSSGIGGSAFYSDLHGFGSQSPSAAFMGSPKNNKSRKSNLSGEQPLPSGVAYNSDGIPDGGVSDPSIHM